MRNPVASITSLAFASLIALAAASCNLDDDEADLAGLIATQFVPLNVDGEDVDGENLTSIGVVAPASFLTAVKREFGHGPDRVELGSLVLRVNTPNVPDWSYLWSGEVTVALKPASSNTVIVVAKGTPPSSFADFKPTLSVTSDTLDAFPDFAEGDFEVHVFGATSRAASDTFQQSVVIEMELLVF